MDFSKPKNLTAVSHPSRRKAWTSYELHTEDGLSVFLTHIDPGVMRHVYRLKSDAVAVSIHEQHLIRRIPSKKVIVTERGDFNDQREGMVSGGWHAGGLGRKRGGVDMLFITPAPELPKDLDLEAGKEVRSEKAEHPEVYSFQDARAQVDRMTGAVRRARILDGPSLKVDLLRLTGRAAVKNTASASSILFAVKGASEVRIAGARDSSLSGNRIFLMAPGAVAHLTPNPAQPAYLLLITPAN